MQLLPDKIAAPALTPRVCRERLLLTMQESLNCCSATIVNGRSGTGKTLLALDFARSVGRPAAWYKVDSADSDLNVFFQYLCASVRRQRPGFAEQWAARFGEIVGIEDVPVLVEYFVYELLQADAPLLIVIDDLHLVYDAEWVVPFFRRLLPLLPAEVHVVLLGRSLPPAPLWRMRSKQTLWVVDETALAFTQREAEELFAGYGLPAESAAQAWQQTRGRAATLDRRARAEAEEKSSKARTADERSARQLRLVKGFMSESSLETA
ncbi:MAG TPA: AAA family ATPase [Pyrinomonadaceae bacterium]|nr:AAA family ATPase [Pyrinomonadaceae bacterium]